MAFRILDFCAEWVVAVRDPDGSGWYPPFSPRLKGTGRDIRGVSAAAPAGKLGK